ncbi:MAG: FAD-dependent oxidoreductase [Patescibacteria group bacterium]
MEEKNPYELIILGAGPAGLTGSIYASRYGITNIVLGALPGGQVSESYLIDNYPGMEDISGTELAKKIFTHAQKYGTEFIIAKAESVKKTPDGFEVELENKAKIKGKTVLLATGNQRKKLNIPGEAAFQGKGVSYCATCDGFFYKEKTVAVIGGSDSAAGAAAHLASIAKKTFLIYRKKELRCEEYWKKILAKEKKIELLFNTNVLEITGSGRVQKIITEVTGTGKKEINLDGVFIEIGAEPDVRLARELGLSTDEEGYIKIKKDGTTEIPGVWAAGDITNGSDKLKQILTAAAEGAIAARSIADYLKK